MASTEEILKQGIPTQANVNYDMSSYNKNFTDTVGAYQKSTSNALNSYKQTGTDNIALLKQQTQAQISNLNQQLNANKQKYQLEGDQQAATINTQYQQANKQIDTQAFENYKMSNQNGMLRGVSNSAQQQAMDNSVAQQTAGLFNDNMTSKNNSLNELKSKISAQMLELDNQYSSDYTTLKTNQLNQQMEMANNMSDKEFEYVSQQANSIMQMQMSNNELQFTTQKEKEQYQSQLAMKLYEMQYSNAENKENQAFQASESQKDRDLTVSEGDKDRSLQKYLSSISGSGSGGSSKSSEVSGETFSEDELIYQEQLAYYREMGTDYVTAMNLAKRDTEQYMNKKQTSAFVKSNPSNTKKSTDLTSIKKRVSGLVDSVSSGKNNAFTNIKGDSGLTSEQFEKMMGLK